MSPLSRLARAAPAIACAWLGLAPLALAAQAAPEKPPGPAPKVDAAKAGAAFAKLPDWTGIWRQEGNTIFDKATVEPKGAGAGTPGVRERPPYNAEWEAKYAANIQKVKDDTFYDPLTFCKPAGMPRMLNLPDTMEWVLRPEQVWYLTENGMQVRRIYTDGRKHDYEILFPTYTGHAIGHWEGDTLVAETVMLRDDTIIDRTGLIHSDKLTLQERIRRLDAETMEDTVTLTDPVAFTRPWVVVKRYKRLPAGSEIYDYGCAENNRNPVDVTGKTLTLGSDGKPIDAKPNAIAGAPPAQ
jgi:hypothetical protein